MNPKKKKTTTPRIKYSPLLAIDAYRLAATGCSDQEMCKVLGITVKRLNIWIKRKKLFRYAIESAKQATENTNTLADYVYTRLDPNLQELWDEMNEEADPELQDKERYFRMQELVAGKNVKEQQHLFIHALINNGFSPSVAIAKTGISKKKLDHWVERDPGFSELLREVDYHKKNYLEEKLMALVEGGHAHATIFANRTQNADRGYGDKSTLTIDGNININHKMVPIESLDLSPDTMRTMLEAMKKAEPLDVSHRKPLPIGKAGKETPIEIDSADESEGSLVRLPEEESAQDPEEVDSE